PENIQPLIILSLEDNNGNKLPDFKEDFDNHVQEKAVISPQLAYLITNVLSDESARWLVFGHPNYFEIGRPAAAKLGRSFNQNQYWSVGFTPQRLVAVWLGAINEETPQPQLATQSMALWYGLTQYTSQGLAVQGWTMPPGIQKLTVCDPSGLLPDKDCPSTVNEEFIQGYEPHQPDNLYITLPVNEQTGRLATVFTPYELVKEKTFMNIPTQAQGWAKSAAIPLPPTEYDVIQAPSNNSPTVKITSPAMFAFVHGKINIIGSADIPGFKYYRLQLGNGLFPRQWIQIGSDVTKSVSEGKLGEWDTKDSNGLYTLQLQVVGDENKLQTALVQISVDNIPPEISIQYPQADQVISKKEHPTLTFQFQPYDDIAIQKVEIYLDGKQLFTLLQAPYVYPWETSLGKHSLKAMVYDLAGNLSKAEITFEVKP
ncbi:MAG: Ig-like domain-containing protein, partial [Anaerolineales bacterium]